MAKQLPPIFKVGGQNLPNNNKTYYYSKDGQKQEIESQEETVMQDATIDQKIDAIFKTRGYAFNIPVTITFAGKTIDTYLAMRTQNSVITLDNENIPISTITSLQVKKPHP